MPRTALPVDLSRLLRRRRERPRDRRANQAVDKFAAPHVGPRRINQYEPMRDCRLKQYHNHQMNDLSLPISIDRLRDMGCDIAA
jgi:hypothetical protein